MDWGTVPAWVGSILTAGSLTLGFYIILRDKKTAEKEQIQKLITREVSNRTKKSPYSSKTLVMTNASDSPFYDVHGAMHGLFSDKPPISWKLRRWLKPRHWPVGTAERRRIARIKYAIQRGGGDTWHFEWPKSDDPHVSNHTLNSEQTVTTGIYKVYPELYLVITAKDAMGRHWALESKTRTIFRYEKLAYR
ncbi:hypothetical protein [Rhodococcus erythropolis]|uniref:Uncharacterized protein n=1 Tax=Rhodococcus erythropolis TaxID=1833 RepID=A0AAX3ZYU0_RHOER|nr:hypothetical protein [Rhodococcus erythropolis]WMN02160.1 hypothetical protein QIE55_33450 [Rhodococcus erythropolis]